VETVQTLAGDCRVEERGSRDAVHRGRVVVLVKPDDTVLVHDADGYQPVAWLTRADSVSVATDPDETTALPDTEPAHPPTDGGANGFVVEAQTDDRSLRIVARREARIAHHRSEPAGTPAGECPECDGPLVRSRDAIRCLVRDLAHPLPAGLTVTGERCPDCERPRVSVNRGATFEVCADRTCEPLDAAVRERFDRAWNCPACGAPLRILRRGGLIAGCDRYLDCETGFAIPAGVTAGECPCGLPAFQTASGRRCLDASCSLTT